MFSVQQKRDISDAVQRILRSTNHPELPETGEISFSLHVDGAADWSFADIRNNGAVGDPGVNPHNEKIAEMPPEAARTLIEEAEALAAPSETFLREMLKKVIEESLPTVNKRLFKAEAIIIDYNKRLNALEDFLTPIIEDNLIQHHDTQLNNLMTAIRQLGNAEINKTLKGD